MKRYPDSHCSYSIRRVRDDIHILCVHGLSAKDKLGSSLV
jgi:hypothetical protein